MGSLDNTPYNPNEFDGVPGEGTFGILRLERPVKLMRTAFHDGILVYQERELAARNRRETCTARWKDHHDKEHWARWWHETVRLPHKASSEKGQKEMQTDFLVLAGFPWSMAQVDIAPFKKHNNKERARRPDPLKERYASEAEFLDWIEKQPQDYFQKSPLRVARVARPTPLQDLRDKQQQPSRPPLLVCGLIEHPNTLESLTEHLLETEILKDALTHARNGTIRFVFPTAPSWITLKDSTKDAAEVLMRLAIAFALAGPESNPGFWYGKPVANFANQTFRELLNTMNRRKSKDAKVSYEEGMASVDPDDSQWDAIDDEETEGMDPDESRDELSGRERNDLLKRLDEERKAVNQLTAKIADFERALAARNETIQTLERLLGVQRPSSD